MGFEELTPDVILNVVEKAAGLKLSSLTIPLPSYINRVYELRSTEGEKVIVKFYRPLRWTRQAILDEHQFIADCAEAELQVVPPRILSNGETLAEYNGILFSLFPKRAGRQLEINDEGDWLRLGSLVGRMHLAGERKKALARITMHPRMSALSDINHLCSKVIPKQSAESYRNTAMRIIEMSAPLFDDLEQTRIHGDCHRGNILDRLDEGLLLIDFDDMAMGPPVQDLWLLLPDRAPGAQHEINLFIEGYERFRRFDRSGLRCIESLRAMRMIYFLGWCGKQAEDALFRKNFPDWGTDKFWQKEINDLREQMGFVMESLEV